MAAGTEHQGLPSGSLTQPGSPLHLSFDTRLDATISSKDRQTSTGCRLFSQRPQWRSLLRLVLDPEGDTEPTKTPVLDSASQLFLETPIVQLRVKLRVEQSLFPRVPSLELLAIAARGSSTR
jgi:hypothetical protein